MKSLLIVIRACFYVKNRSNWNFISMLVAVVVMLNSIACKKFVEVNGPKTSESSTNIYDKDITAASVLTGLYTKLSSARIESGNEITSISYLTALSSDELSFIGNDQVSTSYFTNSLNSQIAGGEFWNNIYPDLYIVNAAIEGLTKSKALTSTVKQQLLGEAKFMRAFYFFYLVNLYGDVPLVLTTDYRLNAQIIRSPQADVWKQIIADLKEAQSLLSEKYLTGDASTAYPLGAEERLRPTKWAATALLARTYLYNKNWSDAAKEATSVINHTSLYQIADLGKVFLKNNSEAIWQLQPVQNGYNTYESEVFIIQAVGLTSSSVSLSQSLISSFDPGDERKNIWTNSIIIDGINYRYAYKYKTLNSVDPNAPVYEYSTVLRLAEQYLIRAEARIQMNDITGGVVDLNVLRDRATDKTADKKFQLKKVPASISKEDALFAVEKERRIELFTEWGHRWLDLKRTDRVDFVMSIENPNKGNGVVWKGYQKWYPIPAIELGLNPNLTQNNGF